MKKNNMIYLANSAILAESEVIKMTVKANTVFSEKNHSTAAVIGKLSDSEVHEQLKRKQ